MSSSGPAAPAPTRVVDHGTSLNLANWILIVTMSLTALLKATSKYLRIRTLQLNDYLILAAMIFAIGEAIAISQQVSAGLGRHVQMSQSQLFRYEKSGYSSEILYVVAVCLAKCSHASFIAGLSKIRWCELSSFGIFGFSIIWGIIGVFTVAFQCSLPHPWQILTAKCINLTAFWGALGALDILIDLTLIALPAYIIWSLQMPASSKFVIILAFSMRILVIPLVVLRIYYISQAQNASDHVYAGYQAGLLTQLAMNIGIITTCIPFLKTIIDRAEHGIFTNDLTLAPGVPHSSQGRSYVMSSMKGTGKDGAAGDRKSLPKLGTPTDWLSSPTQHSFQNTNAEDDEQKSMNRVSEKGVIRKDTRLWVEAETHSGSD